MNQTHIKTARHFGALLYPVIISDVYTVLHPPAPAPVLTVGSDSTGSAAHGHGPYRSLSVVTVTGTPAAVQLRPNASPSSRRTSSSALSGSKDLRGNHFQPVPVVARRWRGTEYYYRVLTRWWCAVASQRPFHHVFFVQEIASACLVCRMWVLKFASVIPATASRL